MSDLRTMPIIMATSAIFAANLAELFCPWVGLNVNVKIGSYTMQVEEDIGNPTQHFF
jgi:hypothetical protein